MENNSKKTSISLSAFTSKISIVIKSFSKIERFVFFVTLFIFTTGAILIASDINKKFMVQVPAEGGSIVEGVIGAPRFINPILSVSDADRDLSALIYSGLMRVGVNGSLVPDLAESYAISEDGLIYTFTLKDDIFFQDGEEINADDIVFTVQKAQDSVLKSPKRASWEGVLVEKVSDREVNFVLSKPYSLFLKNTTLGILPKHIWENVESEQFSFSQFNIEPIGSGPYKVSKIKRNSSGVPVHYDLEVFKKHTLGKPFIKKIRINFYANEDLLISAFKDGDIEIVNAISPEVAEALKSEGYNVLSAPLPRVFGVFFNQNVAPIFADVSVRKALNIALDKDLLIQKVLKGYGETIEGPIPPGSFGYVEQEVITLDSDGPEQTRVSLAREMLERAGWEYNEEASVFEKEKNDVVLELAFSISTSDVAELKNAAYEVERQWEEMGAKVEVKVFEAGNLNQNVIRPRKYDALLFGEIVGRDSDLFAFWHSSQRNDPGLNIASYANITADKLLEEVRVAFDTEERIAKNEEFQAEIIKDMPAVFLYAPDFIYVLPERLNGFRIGSATTPAERFGNVYEWYIETDTIWRLFQN